MAVKLIQNTKEYTGLETDTKPTTKVPEGSTFYQYETVTDTVEKIFKFFGGEWREL